jgi:ATP-dependent Lon protease
MDIINLYCGHEAGVRNLRKCLDRVFRKIVAKLERQVVRAEDEAANAGVAEALIAEEEILKEYQINTKNLEHFLDVSPTDDNYYKDLNKQLPTGSSNGLAYVDDGYGAVLKI